MPSRGNYYGMTQSLGKNYEMIQQFASPRQIAAKFET